MSKKETARKMLRELDLVNRSVNVKGVKGHGAGSVMTSKKPIMGLGASDIEHNRINDMQDELDDDKDDDKNPRVNISRAFKIDINEIKNMIRSILNEKGLS
jgi:hypothetical protein